MPNKNKKIRTKLVRFILKISSIVERFGIQISAEPEVDPIDYTKVFSVDEFSTTVHFSKYCYGTEAKVVTILREGKTVFQAELYNGVNYHMMWQWFIKVSVNCDEELRDLLLVKYREKIKKDIHDSKIIKKFGKNLIANNPNMSKIFLLEKLLERCRELKCKSAG